MRAIAFVSLCGVLTFLGCQHNDRLVEPIPKTAPIASNKYIHFELGDSLLYVEGLPTYTHIDSILNINGNLYYRFRNFPYGPGGVWPDFILRPDSDGNIRILDSYSTDSGMIYTESTLFRFDGGVGSSWTFYVEGEQYLGVLESLTDTVINGDATYMIYTRIHVYTSGCRQEELYWLAPGVGVVKADWEMVCLWTYIVPPRLLSWWNFHQRRYR